VAERTCVALELHQHKLRDAQPACWGLVDNPQRAYHSKGSNTYPCTWIQPIECVVGGRRRPGARLALARPAAKGAIRSHIHSTLNHIHTAAAGRSGGGGGPPRGGQGAGGGDEGGQAAPRKAGRAGTARGARWGIAVWAWLCGGAGGSAVRRVAAAASRGSCIT